jgi:hypothetical protein
MGIKYNLVQNDEQGALTCFFDGEMYTADNTHASWPAIVAAVTSANDSTDLRALAQLFDPSAAVQSFFNKVSERVSVAGGHVFFDGEEVNDGLSNHIIRFMNEGNQENASALVNFMEKVQTNPNEHSRTQLYDWLSKRDFTITPEGDFLAYKGVRPRGGRYGATDGLVDLDKYPYESISTGRAIVDGQAYDGAIPNGVGAVVEMPRGEVAHDPNVACHTGLHAGNYRYASSFSQGALLTVQINPRDVVSVPHDSDSEKIRCCRYVVKEINEKEYTSSYYSGFSELDEDYAEEEDYEDDDCDCDDCLDA